MLGGLLLSKATVFTFRSVTSTIAGISEMRPMRSLEDMSSFTKVLFVILATIRLAEAQDPATEEEWRAIHAKTKREYDSANSGRWSSVVLVGVGTSLAIY